MRRSNPGTAHANNFRSASSILIQARLQLNGCDLGLRKNYRVSQELSGVPNSKPQR